MRTLSASAVGAVSVPSAAVVFVLGAPWLAETSDFRWEGLAVFAGIGLLFPAAVTMLVFESTRRVGPTLTGTIGGLTPLFAIAGAVAFLGEVVSIETLLGALVVFAGIAILMGTAGLRRAQRALWLPVVAAAIRGAAQAATKLGLALWAAPYVAAMTGYVVSAIVLRAAVAVGVIPGVGAVPLRRRLMFVLLGVTNGLVILFLYAALMRAPLAAVSCIYATYPVFTLLVGALLRVEKLTPRAAIGVAVSVAGVAVVLLSR